ncbi:terminase large subunit domain-containing protein [Cytobacillus praedii]|uniref:terminase large subunit domain-containing protein n=1 Tax=Cytobacillus praedii TaxID=1742358 RepID=UPI002E1B54E5|nr:terminase large subunit [Cytobacillus praedii]
MTENKAYKYAESVLSGRIVAPSQIKQSCKNFIREFDVLQKQNDYKYFWCEKTEKFIVGLLDNLNFARGAKQSESIGKNLSLWQWYLILNVFCVQWKEFAGRRKYREIVVTMSRKNSKTIVAALIHIIAFYIDQENTTHYLASNNKKQAKNIFDEMSEIIKASPNILPHFKLQETYIKFLLKNGKLEYMSGDSRKADGTMPFVATIDEAGADNSISKMIASIKNGQKGPRNPLIIIVSTSYGVKNGHNYWHDVIEELKKNTFSDTPNERKFGLAFNIDNPEEKIIVDGVEMERWMDKSTWMESNPLLAEIPVLAEQLHEDYEAVKNIADDLHEFKIKSLNIWLPDTNLHEEYLVDEETLQQYIYEPAQDWKWWANKKQVMIGLDVSMSRDNTSLTFHWYDKDNEEGNGAGITYIKNLVLYPKAMEAEKVKAEGLDYDKWSELEFPYCMPFGDKVVDWEKIGPYVDKEILQKYNIKLGTMLYDTKYAEEISDYFDQYVSMEIPPTAVKQDSRNLGDVISRLQKDIYDGKFRYAPNKLFESSMINSELYYPMGKVYIRKPESGKHSKKVDSTFSTLNAFKGHMFFKRDNRYSSITNFF